MKKKLPKNYWKKEADRFRLVALDWQGRFERQVAANGALTNDLNSADNTINQINERLAEQAKLLGASQSVSMRENNDLSIARKQIEELNAVVEKSTSLINALRRELVMKIDSSDRLSHQNELLTRLVRERMGLPTLPQGAIPINVTVK
jgi:Tfp pilus assembly protein PilN